MHAEKEVLFRDSAAKALLDPQLRANFRRAMDGLITKRRNQFPDPRDLQDLRDLSTAIRSRSLLSLPELLEQFEANCTKNGIQVHWAETCEQANELILGIMQAKGAKTLVKGKSMVSEEMHLNAFLESKGIEALESDLGEYIIQLDGETPSHIIMPAIHKNKNQIARQFSQKIKDAKYTEDVDELTAMARKVLREKFLKADAGLSGVNFAVAETGTLCLVENEGNGRLSTTAPEVHIAVMGLEKVVARLDQIPPLLTLLTRSATGQPITTYFNMISGPRRPGEKDGPREVHLILLDNGRSRIHADPELRDSLRCIRCAACINHCPIYTRLGGHAYGTVDPGPIGTVIEPQLQGLRGQGELASASTLCGACGEVCPVRIPLPTLINRLRWEGVRTDAGTDPAGVLQRGTLRKPLEALAWRLWAWLHANPGMYRLATGMAARLRGLQPKRLGPWSHTRSGPRLAAKGLHRLAREEGIPPE